jgi:predicted oxidoreductase
MVAGADHSTTTSLGGVDGGVARRRIDRCGSPTTGEHADAGEHAGVGGRGEH